MADSTPHQRLQNERNVWMATTRPDGRPHLAPVWFVYIDDRIWVGTGTGSVRVSNVRANPNASISLEDGNTPIVAEGVVLEHSEARPDAVVAAFLDKYDWDLRISDDEDVGQVTLLEVRPRKWLFAELPVVA